MKNLIEIAKNSYDSYYYAYSLNFKNVPEIIIKSISKNSHNSYWYAKHLNYTNVPLIIIKSVVTDGNYDFYYTVKDFPENKHLLCYILKLDKRMNIII